jgi:hypothetical protein
MTRNLLLLFLISLLSLFPLAAQDDGGNGESEGDGGNGDSEIITSPTPAEPEGEEGFVEPYGLGSQTFTIGAGVFLPLFFQYPSPPGDVRTIEPALGQMSVGGQGSLCWEGYLTSRFSMGVELAGTFSFGPNGYVHSLIPITAKASYLFRSGSFEFPVFLHGGMVLNNYRDQVYFGPIVKPGLSGYWNLNAEWGLGLSMKYLWVPEIYFDKPEATSFGNFLNIGFSARYHFSS